MGEETPARSQSKWLGQSVLVLSPTPTHPINFGNRRRIYHVCRRLKDLGATITFLHYPAEHDWRAEVPQKAQRDMMMEWDGYYVVPTTREIHSAPINSHHTADEWWDPAIGEFLNWLFKTTSFDIVIVNYAWLSKAFLHVPAGTTKILDTHDRFSGRRELLERNGIAPEFFYMTEGEERIALDRADIVWAIKGEEEAFFRTLTSRPVLTVLHAEPLMGRSHRQLGGIVRFGIVGARNSINAKNINEFLEEAYRYLQRTLLPCEIVIAGSCCELLVDRDVKCIHLLGRVNSMDEFYNQIDVVLGPMQFSTGLKIKIGEALSYGKAVISHAHCFEGYVQTHEYHKLQSFHNMMVACETIVRNPALIADLEDASVRSMHRANKLVADALEATLNVTVDRASTIVVVVSASALRPGSLVLDHVVEVAEYIAHQSEISFYIDGPAENAVADHFRRMQKFGKLVCSSVTRESLKERYRTVAGRNTPVASLDQLMEAGELGFWFTCIPTQPPHRGKLRNKWAMLPVGIVSWTSPDEEVLTFARQLAKCFDTLVISDTERSGLLAALSNVRATQCVVPWLWRGHASTVLRMITSKVRKFVTVLASDLENPLVALTLEVCTLYVDGCVEVVYADRRTDVTVIDRFQQKWPRVTFSPLSRYFEVLGCREAGPKLVLQVGESSVYSGVMEVMHRACVPAVRLFDSAQASLRLEVEGLRWREAGVGASVDLMVDLLTDLTRIDLMKRERAERYSYQNDAGWTHIWSMVKGLIQTEAI